MVCLWTKQLAVCCWQVVCNTWEKNIFTHVILRPIDDSSNANHIICLGNIFHWNRDFHIIKEMSPVRSQSQWCTSIPYQRHILKWAAMIEMFGIVFETAAKDIQTIHNWLGCGLILPLLQLLCFSQMNLTDVAAGWNHDLHSTSYVVQCSR